MAKFRYRMQSVLDVKLKLEEQAKNEFAQAQLRLNEEEDKLQALFDRKASYEEEAVAMRQASLRVLDILANQEAIIRMDEYIAAQYEVIERQKEVVEEKRRSLTLVMQERKGQEKLKEKAFQEFVKEQNALESKEIDELVSYTYGQKKEA